MKGSFEELVEEHRTALLWYCRKQLALDDDTIDDLMAEVWTKAWKAWDKFDGRYPRTWLTTIARNTHINNYRKAQKRDVTLLGESVDLEYIAPRAQSSEDEHLDHTLDPQLVEALNSLNDLQTEAFVSFTIYNMSYQEIAEAQKVPVGTIMSRMFRARHRLAMTLT